MFEIIQKSSIGGSPSVLIIGSATRDTILYGTQTIRKIGGVVTYAGLTFRRQEVPCLAKAIRLTSFLPLLKSATLVHLGPLHPGDLDPECLAILSRSNKTITLDVQGYVRKIRDGRVFPAVSKYLAEALRLARVIKAGSEEMETILESYDMEIETFQNFFGIDEILVTSGRKGARSIHPLCGSNRGESGGRTVHHPRDAATII